MKKITLFLTAFLFALFIQSAFAQSAPRNTPICNGLATYLPKPEVPQSVINANGKNIFGVVNVQILIDEKGNVEKAQAVSGHPLVRPLAEKAALKAKFRVTTNSGKPVKVNCVVAYNFKPRKETKLIVTAEFPQKIIISVPKPEYPKSAKFVNASGEVSVEVIIDKDGNVESARSVSGHPLLRSASEKAALRAKFKPTILSGKPVRAITYLIYNFVSSRTVETGLRNEEIILGQAENLPKPPFPSFNGKIGTNRPKIFVQAEIDENGNVTSAKAISGHPILRTACERAARNSKFSQTKISGVPVKAKAVIVYEYILGDEVIVNVEVQSIEAIKPNSESKL